MPRGSLLTYAVAVTFSILLALTAARGAELLLGTAGPSPTLDRDAQALIDAARAAPQSSSAPGTGSVTGSTRFK